MSTQYGDPTTRNYPDQDRDRDRDRDERGGWGGGQQFRAHRRDKPFFLTSEFLTLVAAVAAIAIAAAVADNFEAPRAWTLITIAAAAYIVSRGLSKINRGDGHIDR
jgi:hypothetical protein